MSRCGIHGAAVAAGVGNVANLGQRVEVKNADVSGRSRARNIKIAGIRIGGHVIHSTVAADQLDLEHFVGAAVLREGASRKRHKNC